MADRRGSRSWGTWAVSLVLLGLVTSAGCSVRLGSDDQLTPGPDTGPLDFVTQVGCPGEGTRQGEPVPFEPVAEPVTAAVEVDLVVHSDGRLHCVTSDYLEAWPASVRLEEYTVTARGPGIYEQSYTTRDPDGSEELLNFPFHVHRHGGCVTVTATMTLVDDGGAERRYRATDRMGPRC